MTQRRSLQVIALIFGVAGVSHFVIPAAFERIVPPWVSDAHAAVFWSGVAELLGAVGLLMPATRVTAGWGLIALLVAVLPANVQMLLNARSSGASTVFEVALWARLPLQPALMWWVWRTAATKYALAT